MWMRGNNPIGKPGIRKQLVNSKTKWGNPSQTFCNLAKQKPDKQSRPGTTTPQPISLKLCMWLSPPRCWPEHKHSNQNKLFLPLCCGLDLAKTKSTLSGPILTHNPIERANFVKVCFERQRRLTWRGELTKPRRGTYLEEVIGTRCHA
jgi:hypothetical protein